MELPPGEKRSDTKTTFAPRDNSLAQYGTAPDPVEQTPVLRHPERRPLISKSKLILLGIVASILIGYALYLLNPNDSAPTNPPIPSEPTPSHSNIKPQTRALFFLLQKT